MCLKEPSVKGAAPRGRGGWATSRGFCGSLICHPKEFRLIGMVQTQRRVLRRTAMGSVFCVSKVAWRGCVKWNGRKGTGGRDQVGGYYSAVGATDKGLSQDWGRKGAG